MLPTRLVELILGVGRRLLISDSADHDVRTSAIARTIGRIDDATRFDEKAARLKSNVLKYHWDKDQFSFWTVRRRDGRRIKRISYSNFVPLIQKDLISDSAKRK